MAANRIHSYASRTRIASITMNTGPQKNAVSIPHGFAVCPPQLATANAWQQEVYRLAYERAKAAAEVPRHYRLLFSVWN
jgi:hypothetical protein